MQDATIYDMISVLIYQNTGIFILLKPQYITCVLGLCLVYKFRITGSLLVLHACILYMYDVQLAHEQKYLTELSRSVYGAFYEDHLWYVVYYSIIAIPIITFLGYLLDTYLAKKKHEKLTDNK